VKLTSYNWLKEEKYITDFNISKVAIAKKRLSNINQVTWLQKLIKCLVYKESILVQHKLSVYKQGNMFVDDMYKKNSSFTGFAFSTKHINSIMQRR